MPLEVVKVAINRQNKSDAYIKKLRSMEGRKHGESMVDVTNRFLGLTVQETHDIKVYKVFPDKKKNDQSDDLESDVPVATKRVLIGSEFTRYIVNKEKKAVRETIGSLQQAIDDPVNKPLRDDHQKLQDALISFHEVSVQNKISMDRDDEKSAEYTRRHYMKMSEQTKKKAEMRPELMQAASDKTTEECIDWAIQTSQFYASRLEEDLFRLENKLRDFVIKSPSSPDGDALNHGGSDDDSDMGGFEARKRSSVGRLGNPRERNLLVNVA